MPIAELKNEQLLEYCKDRSSTDSGLLIELEKYTWENEDVPQMICGQLVGNFLQSVIKLSQAKRIVEVGTFTGYSALKMAEALPDDGEIHTLELMEKHANTAQSFFDRSKNGSKITIHRGPALASLEQLKSTSFDMAFIDADKTNYLEYYKRCLTLMRNGGAIVLDNMLWGGDVLEPQDDDAKALRKTGEFIQNDERVFNTLLPIRDGLMFCIKNER
ncbi:MAG: class I SAM-dependent methyltransferase [Candidatus Marinimicrobia bacterium]|nr:class I SAM-dependent methyltransferase [Candidatus Neomarinimicrobiota bacterium]